MSSERARYPSVLLVSLVWALRRKFRTELPTNQLQVHLGDDKPPAY